jgi:GntR family transcriptional regulator
MAEVKDAPSPTASAPSRLRLRAPDRGAATTLHEQVAAEIRRAIANGEAEPGERIPKAQDLAAVLGVNTNTVLRALRVLQDEGLLELKRRRGITVAATPDDSSLVQHAHALLTAGHRLGYNTDEIHALIDKIATARTGTGHV